MEGGVFTRLARPVGTALAIGIVVAGAAWFFWRRDPEQAGYPFAPGVPGQLGALWTRSPAELDRLSKADTERLEHVLARLDAAMDQAVSRKNLLASEELDKLRAEDRQSIRQVWSDLLEPLLALDDIKERYSGFWGIDYKVHPVLHSRSFGLTYAALCAEVEAGQKLVKLLGDHKLAPTLFDEAMAEYGVPAGTFAAFRKQLARSRDLSYVPAGDGWFHLWIERHLKQPEPKLAELVDGRAAKAKDSLGAAAVVQVARNKGDIVKGEAFRRWFPLQKEVAEWMGDTRVVPQERRLISDAQIVEMRKALRPGDVVIERRNWYLSNVGLPGFWPHAAIFVGEQQDIAAAFDTDPETQKRFGTFSKHLAEKRADGWKSLGEKDSQGHPHSILEAVSEGVVASSVEHSLGADYVGALRPRLAIADIATAIDRAFSYFGRPYDFNFDFATDDQVVCSELVVKAYEPPSPLAAGLRIPFITVAGRRAVPPTEIVRTFANERGKPDRQFDFVYFLDGREGGRAAVVADEETLARSVTRPKWDIAQP